MRTFIFHRNHLNTEKGRSLGVTYVILSLKLKMNWKNIWYQISTPRFVVVIAVRKSFANFTGKHLCWSKKRLPCRCFLVKFLKLLRTSFLWNTFRLLLLFFEYVIIYDTKGTGFLSSSRIELKGFCSKIASCLLFKFKIILVFLDPFLPNVSIWSP